MMQAEKELREESHLVDLESKQLEKKVTSKDTVIVKL